MGSVISPKKPKVEKPPPPPPAAVTPPEERGVEPEVLAARERTRRVARARFAGRSSTILTSAGGLSGGTTAGIVGSKGTLGG